MKALFFLMVIANVALLMWEYKKGAFVPATEISEQSADVDQELILLVSELKNVPKVITPAPAPERLKAENSPVELAPALENSMDKDSNSSEVKRTEAQELTLTENLIAESLDKAVLTPNPLPLLSESIDKPVFEKPTVRKPNNIEPDKMEVLCYEAGPFTNKEIYQAWMYSLKDSNSEIKSISRDEKVANKYMVYYPAGETNEAIQENSKMLKNNGIKDFWILAGADNGKISLGLFSREEAALVMKNELLAKGIHAEVAPKYKTKSQNYVLIKGDSSLKERLNNLKKTHPELPVKPITDDSQACK